MGRRGVLPQKRLFLFCGEKSLKEESELFIITCSYRKNSIHVWIS